MSEENQNELPSVDQTENVQPVEPVQDVEPAASVETAINEEAAPEYVQQNPDMTQPQIIVQRERGFAHYVGFALLCVLCICFFFMPGIAITYGVSCIVDLTGAAAWIFSSILSVVAWLFFKIKIKGFKKSFYWYIGLCVLVLAILVTIQVITEHNIFAGIIALLTGAKA
ncbi:MAG: hypothetical protein MJY82_04920 [Fibrobacter sp.]|nr:hypothetical protein [Fibrobacter sp.]